MTNHKKISNMRSFKIILLASFLGLLVVGCGIKKMVSRYPEVTVKLADENLENKGGQQAQRNRDAPHVYCICNKSKF